MTRTLLLLMSLLIITGCSSKQYPMLYPKNSMQEKTPKETKGDVKACMHDAEKHLGKQDSTRGMYKSVLLGTLGGLALGVGMAESLETDATQKQNFIRGSALGIGGAVLVTELYHWGKPSYAFKNFVRICLEEKGYRVLGWR